MKYRIGFGYDVHQLKEGEDLILGGIQLAHSKGTVGHSDADALIHAICDALLGAANLGDIGQHFPDTSQDFKNIDSKILLKEVVALLKRKGYSVGNIDCTVCLELPKLAPHIAEMARTMANVMNIDAGDVSIKATTNERMGFVGREDGVAAYAVVLIQS
ncbi:MAG: 2-C-methyl-D-erythritol 2,4-cyclodiphosphate synthase [Flavobacteriales bacterium]|nr:2-C-methyl-D-erythritol 2,4-cyclodiphosphate synthase [Flavobacteriales bacterium]